MLLEMSGTTPLMMHNIRLADVEDTYAQTMAPIAAKKSKMTSAERLEVGRLEFAGGLYYDPHIGPFLPAQNIFRTLMQAGALSRKGTDVQRGVMFESIKMPLEYDGPRDIDALWGNGDTMFVDRRMVNSNPTAAKPSMVPRYRPIFPEWSVSVRLTIDDRVLDKGDLVEIADRAGKLIGVGDYRRFYGRFDAAVSGD